MYEAKLKQYDMELNRIEDKLKSVDDTDKDFYVTATWVLDFRVCRYARYMMANGLIEFKSTGLRYWEK